MAINPETQYPGKIAPASPEYPYGEARNITTPSDGTGTPWEAALVNDLFGFQQSLLSTANIVPTGNPDKANLSQYTQALFKTSGRVLDDYTQLRAIESDNYSDGTLCILTNTEVNGEFKLDKSDVVTADDSGTVIVDADGGRWKRPSVSFINVQWFGVLPGAANAITNCAAYAKLAAYINAKSGFTTIHWPADTEAYEFSPKDDPTFNSSDNSWRIAVELVDVTRVIHEGSGATVYQRADATWFRGNSNTGAGAVSIGMDESPLQFRSSVQDGCQWVGVRGLKIRTDATTQDSTPTYSDGNTFGIAYRGCNFTVTEDVEIELFGTDGLYYGTGYGNSPSGRGHYLRSPNLHGNYRQGVSIVGNDDGVIIGGEIKDTIGSTFGYAVDFEPNVGRQSNWTITGLKTSNNERGACNHIRSQNIKWINCDFDEQSNSGVNSGCTRIDGSQDSATLTNAISFDGCRITGLTATVYFSGNYFDDVTYNNCTFLCTGDVNVASQFRINSSDSANVGTVSITNSTISGNGGINVRGVTGGLPTKIVFTGNVWFPSDESASTKEWIFDTNSTFVEAVVTDNIIDHTRNTWTLAGTYQPYVAVGTIEGNVFESTSSFVIEWRDWGAARETKIGMNTWGQYSYYDGPASALDLKSTVSAVQRLEVAGGDFGLSRRVVHGGRQRIITFAATPANFVDEQAPQDGDILWNLANNTANLPQTSYVYDTAFGGWRINSWITLIGTTANRPNVAATMVPDTGIQYLDTTIGANGIVVTWNGANWVDGVGAIV